MVHDWAGGRWTKVGVQGPPQKDLDNQISVREDGGTIGASVRVTGEVSMPTGLVTSHPQVQFPPWAAVDASSGDRGSSDHRREQRLKNTRLGGKRAPDSSSIVSQIPSWPRYGAEL